MEKILCALLLVANGIAVSATPRQAISDAVSSLESLKTHYEMELLDIQNKRMTGHIAEAAKEEFDHQNKALIMALEAQARGDPQPPSAPNHIALHHGMGSTQQHIAQFCANAGGGILSQSSNAMTCGINAGILNESIQYVLVSSEHKTTEVTWNVTASAVGMGGVAGAQEVLNRGVYQLNEAIYQVYSTLEALQGDLDAWIASYNHERTHQGKMCCGRTPMATFDDGKRICLEKSIT